MQDNKWKSIWDKKRLDDIDLSKSEFEIFCDLKKADGFDVNVHDEEKYFRAFYNDWLEMCKRVNEIAQNDIKSVYEVGCGSGVNLYLFKNRIKEAVLGGIDYSQGMIDIAKNVISSTDLVCGSAENIDVQKKYDLVMADSVFQYFSGEEYAEDVLHKMIMKSNKIVYISEIHDVNLREEWLAYRRQSMENYDQVYEGLDKVFYSKDWIVDIAKKHNRQVIFTKSDNPEYWNSRYIFNCFIF
ncbi:MAG: class I SAM-dependent methyltransferase [Lachnospiraceae bacterium]|nr:class I SAM-dependent methyltransferase [Lachnospiraceae bacterium]